LSEDLWNGGIAMVRQRKPPKSEKISPNRDREYWRMVHGMLKANVMLLARINHENEDRLDKIEEHLEALIISAQGWLDEMRA
jgi:hypothetical protein